MNLNLFTATPAVAARHERLLTEAEHDRRLARLRPRPAPRRVRGWAIANLLRSTRERVAAVVRSEAAGAGARGLPPSA